MFIVSRARCLSVSVSVSPFNTFFAGVGDIQLVGCRLGFAVGAMVGACFRSQVWFLFLLLPAGNEKLCKVASCWIVFDIDSRCTDP